MLPHRAVPDEADDLGLFGLGIGFGSEENGFDFRLEHDPAFRRRIESARESRRGGQGDRLDDVGDGMGS